MSLSPSLGNRRDGELNRHYFVVDKVLNSLLLVADYMMPRQTVDLLDPPAASFHYDGED